MSWYPSPADNPRNHAASGVDLVQLGGNPTKVHHCEGPQPRSNLRLKGGDCFGANDAPRNDKTKAEFGRRALAKIGRLFLLLALLVCLMGGSAISAGAAAFAGPSGTRLAASTITYIGNIGSMTSKTSGTSLVINTTAAVAAGDDIIIAYATDPNSNIPPISVTDAAGNTYSQVGFVVNSGQLRTYMFAAYDVNALPSGSSITITASASVAARAAVASVFSGLAVEDPLDQTSTGTGSSATPSSGATAPTAEARRAADRRDRHRRTGRRRRRNMGELVHGRLPPGHDRRNGRHEHHTLAWLSDRFSHWRIHCRKKWYCLPRLGGDDRHFQGRAQRNRPSDHHYGYAFECLQQCAWDAFGGTALHGVRQQPDR